MNSKKLMRFYTKRYNNQDIHKEHLKFKVNKENKKVSLKDKLKNINKLK